MNINDDYIALLDPRGLLNKDFLYALLEIQEPEEKERLSNLAALRASELGVETKFARTLREYNKAQAELEKAYTREGAKRNASIPLDYDSSGKPLKTIYNYYTILSNDKKFDDIKYNLLSCSPEHTLKGKTVRWVDADNADAKMYIEKKYKFRSDDCFRDALRIILRERSYHPIQDYIKGIKWDGTDRIEDFLHKWTLCEDTPYTREASRLIFAGGIHRLFEPGCKFDDMIVLVGTKQGEGKSTFVQWLAMKEDWYKEVTVFEGREGFEALKGGWICEVGELLALTKAKEQEAVKAYLSRQVDHFRNPYAEFVDDNPRQCIFIGTTNKEAFLTDKTGNRRFYPIRVKQTGYALWDQKAEVLSYIEQCWAQAYAMIDQPLMQPYLRRELVEAAREQQKQATEEDYRDALIESYLEDKDVTCILDLWENALGNASFTKPSKKDSNELALIMQNIPGWSSAGNRRMGKYGAPKCWAREKKYSPENDIDLDERSLLFSDIESL